MDLILKRAHKMKAEIFILLCAYLVQCLSLSYVEKVGQEASGSIVDLGFEFIPQVSSYNTDLFAFVFPLAVLVILYMKRNYAQLRQFIRDVAAIMVIRAICVASTVLPPSHPDCRADMLVYLHGGCYDKVFSGHVAYLTLSTGYLFQIYRVYSLFIPLVIEGLLMIQAREHYTVDILVAIFIGILIRGRA